nr:MAG TPA: hypothetical protein [Caudoviricetes sp.]
MNEIPKKNLTKLMQPFARMDSMQSLEMKDGRSTSKCATVQLTTILQRIDGTQNDASYTTAKNICLPIS